MSDGFEIRAAGLPSAQALTTLHAESFGKECWSFDQMRGSLALTTTKAWAGFDNGTPIAFILCQILPEQAEILTFCVSPSKRRGKIGATLLQHALQEIGDGKITLEVAADNHAARALYERNGFTTIGTRPNYYKRGAVTVDGVLYNWSNKE